MALRLDIKPCWKYQCPHCDRVFRAPTTRYIQENGAFMVANHLASVHDVAYTTTTGTVHWEKDHYPWIREG